MVFVAYPPAHHPPKHPCRRRTSRWGTGISIPASRSAGYRATAGSLWVWSQRSTLFRVRGVCAISADQRAQAIAGRIEALARDRAVSPDALRVVEVEGAALYALLHQNILDAFNEYSIQIMTPAYRGDPEQPKLVPREQWFGAPARSPSGEGTP